MKGLVSRKAFRRTSISPLDGVQYRVEDRPPHLYFMMDDSRHLRLDVKELLLKICIGDFRLPFGPRFEMTWQCKVALFLYNRPHVMKGVVRIPHTASSARRRRHGQRECRLD